MVGRPGSVLLSMVADTTTLWHEVYSQQIRLVVNDVATVLSLSLSLAPSSTRDESKAIVKAERKIDDRSARDDMVKSC